MSVFCPEGYVPTTAALFRAANWFPDRMAALEGAIGSGSETKPDNSVDAAARAFSQTQVPDALRLGLQEMMTETAYRLRNSLHQGKLKAYYFGDEGCQHVSGEFWPTPRADGVLESGTYWPFGAPARWYERLPNYPLFLLRSELDALLSEQRAATRPFPHAKMPELVAALRKLDDLPNRVAQFQALGELPEFRGFTITHALFREAAKRAGQRPAGRKSRRQS